MQKIKFFFFFFFFLFKLLDLNPDPLHHERIRIMDHMTHKSIIKEANKPYLVMLGYGKYMTKIFIRIKFLSKLVWRGILQIYHIFLY